MRVLYSQECRETVIEFIEFTVRLAAQRDTIVGLAARWWEPCEIRVLCIPNACLCATYCTGTDICNFRKGWYNSKTIQPVGSARLQVYIFVIGRVLSYCGRDNGRYIKIRPAAGDTTLLSLNLTQARTSYRGGDELNDTIFQRATYLTKWNSNIWSRTRGKLETCVSQSTNACRLV